MLDVCGYLHSYDASFIINETQNPHIKPGGTVSCVPLLLLVFRLCLAPKRPTPVFKVFELKEGLKKNPCLPSSHQPLNSQTIILEMLLMFF